MEAERRSGNGPLTLNTAAGRYWTEVGERHADSVATYRDIKRIVNFLGPNKRLDEITDGDVAALVTARLKETVKRGGKTVPLAPATVNRTTLVPLKAIFMRAKRTWRYAFPGEPIWRDHWLAQPEERVRELDAHEADALDGAVRDDYALWFQFARLTGLRRNETLITWAGVNRAAGIITGIGKRGRKVTTPITSDVATILDACEGHHDAYVFTFVCQRTRGGQVKGHHYPITPAGAKTHWRRLRARSGVKDFRFHDIRHDVATKLLRATGNLKIVQRALNHANIATTTKYAHVQTDEVAAALEAVARSRKQSHEKPHGTPPKSL